jgi:uncharacterized protein YggE
MGESRLGARPFVKEDPMFSRNPREPKNDPTIDESPTDARSTRLGSTAWWPVAVGLLAILLIAWTVGRPPLPAAVAQAPEPTRNRIVVTGEGRVQTAPDQATVTAGAQVQHARAAEAISQANQIVERMLARWRQLGLRPDQLRTAGVQVTPVHGSGRGDNAPPQITAYQAINIVAATVDDVRLVGRVLDAAIEAGANTAHGISFGLRDSARARADALTQAVREARAKADVIAQAAGVRIRAVEHIAEGGAEVMTRDVVAARISAAPTPIEPGTVGVRASMTVTFSF